MAMSVVYATINGQIVSENRGGVISYYVPDNLGSTVALLDATGTVTDTFTYWPYGEIQSHVGSSVTPFTFCGTVGYYTDVLGSQMYVRARYLRQALTRWLTQDPLWPDEAPFGYCLANPVLFVDPTGELTGCDITYRDCGSMGAMKGCRKKCASRGGVAFCWIINLNCDFCFCGVWPCVSVKSQWIWCPCMEAVVGLGCAGVCSSLCNILTPPSPWPDPTGCFSTCMKICKEKGLGLPPGRKR